MGEMKSKELPCYDCGTKTLARSACPLCKRVVCQRCAEKPYESCCTADDEEK